jgi:hypothetical protein
MNWPAPEWYNWELEISSHVEKRMIQRNFTEIELRTMLVSAQSYEKDFEEGRYLVKSKLNGKGWEIIVEPDYEEKMLVIITAYSTGD